MRNDQAAVSVRQLSRRQVLVAFGDIENSLAGIAHLADQTAAQDRAVASARRAADLATDRYRAGIVSYLEERAECRPDYQAKTDKTAV